MRQEAFFVRFIGDSLNTLIGHPKSSMVYRGQKKKILAAMVATDIKRKMEPFSQPVTISYTPLVAKNSRGQVPKAYDTLNFAPTYKAIEDYLVKFGKLRDDSRDFVRATHCYAPQVLDHGHAADVGIHVVVREVELDHGDNLSLF